MARRWAILAIAALVAVSCSSGDTDEADEPPASSTTSTTTTEAVETDDDGDDDTSRDEAIPDWPLDDTPLSLDDGVEIGTLDNGLTYYLRENASPGDSLTIRLVVDAGARQQEQVDDGVAHFLEHMLFNGTERWPGNELDRVLQGLGVGIGPDVNAYTSLDETVYVLNVSTFQDGAVETAVEVMAEWASRATIDPEQVTAERGVVRDEYRQSYESAPGELFLEFFDVYTRDTPYADRIVLGSIEEIESTDAEVLRAFYDRWYHPENMAVIAVGDLPVDDMRTLIEDAFAGLEGRGEAPGRAERLEIEPGPAGFAEVITNREEVVDNLSVDWLRPPSDPSTIGGARADLLDDLVASMLGNRLDDAYLAGEFAVDRTPFLGRFAFARHLDFFGTNLRGDDLTLIYAQLLGYLEQAAQAGFTEEELAEAVSEREADLSAWEESLATTQDLAWSDAYVSHFLSGVGGEAPETTIERERAILTELSVDEVSRRWAFVHDRSGPIAIALGVDASTLPTIEELEAVAAAVEPIEPVGSEDAITELMQPPAPVEPDSVDRRDGAFDTLIVRRYANGVTLVFEPSPIVEGTVSLLAEGLGGASTLDIDQHNLAFLAANVVGRSGFDDATTGQVNDFLADRSVAVETWISDYAEGFEGNASTDDVEVLFQLIHLGVTQPSVDPTVLASAIVDGEGLLDRLATDPGLQASAALSSVLLADTRYDGFTTQAQLDTANADLLLDLYRQRLGSTDDLIVAVTGDIDAATITDLGDRYLGTLPAGEADTFRDITAPLADSVERVDIVLPPESGDSGIQLRWESAAVSPDDGAVCAVLGQIISSLIFDTAREELGASYSGSASVFPTTVPHAGVVGFVAIDGDPTRLDEIQQRLFADLERLAAEGPTADEFDRAVTLLVDDLQFINNFELMLENIETERLGEPPEMSIYTRVVEILDVDPADVRRLAASLFDLDAYIEIRRS
ncbi:MAG: insulinase family protein [Actinomycetota bacterium]